MRSLLRVAAIAVLSVVAAPLATTATPRPAYAAAAAQGGIQTPAHGSIQVAARGGIQVAAQEGVRVAAHGGIHLVIDSVAPRYARPGGTVSVSGTITNGTSAAVAGLSVQLYSSSTWFSTRDTMESFVNGAPVLALTAEGDIDVLAATVRAGSTVSWRAKFSVDAVGMTEFGVYPLEAQLTDLAGEQVSSERTLLPFLPDNTSAISKLKIAWLWPLIDQPHRTACPALSNNGLAQSLAAGGRLSTLLSAAAANPQADITWAIDPALLGDATTMSSPYQVATGRNWKAASCTGATVEPASAAAATWLRTVKSATAGQPVVITPYANTDVAALVHQGLNQELNTAYLLGQQVAQRELGTPSFDKDLALPAGGLADQSVLTSLAATRHVTSVVLSSGEMPPVDSTVPSGDDAVTTIRTGAGTRMDVLLADDTMTSLLKSAAGATSAGAQFGLEQRFLAETAMIASEFPTSNRSVVISPPQTWGPSLALAQALLQETSAPWLQPVTLSSLAGSHDSESRLARRPPPSTKVSPRELGGSYLAEVSALDATYSTFKAMLYPPMPAYTTSLEEALAATESSAWRGGSVSGGQALVTAFNAYLKTSADKVKIIASPEITMAGSSGQLPVPIQNSLKEQSVQVRLSASVTTLPGQTHPLTLGGLDDVIRIKAGQTVVVKLHVGSAPSGSTDIHLSLVTIDGRQVGDPTTLTVHSTRYGQAILILIAGAIGLMVLMPTLRAGRRFIGDGASRAGPGADRARPGAGKAGQGADAPSSGAPSSGAPSSDAPGTDPAAPGNVLKSPDNPLGTAANDPTEAPDDLADARRWADDT